MPIAMPTSFINNSTTGLLKFAWFTDLHWDPNMAPYSGRFPMQGQSKLQASCNVFNQTNLDFIIQTGDFIDGATDVPSSQSAMQTIWANLQAEATCQTFYHVHGNHDLEWMSKAQAISILGMPSSFYSFNAKGFHCIVLDAEYYQDNDSSNYPLPATGFNETDSYINPAQRAWLIADLAATKLPSLIFLHAPTFQQPNAPTLWLSNPSELLPIIQGANVAAVFNGHAHVNGLNISQTIGGVPFITGQALTENDYSAAPTTSFAAAIVTANPNNKAIQVAGFGGLPIANFSGESTYSLGAR